MENSGLQFYRISHKPFYACQTTATGVMGSFLQKAHFEHETYRLVDTTQGSVSKTEVTLGISNRKGFNGRNLMLVKRN